MSEIKVDPIALEAIKSLLAEKRSEGPVRIELQFTGCCDPSLGLLVDEARESDIVADVDGVRFVIDPQAQELAGEISIAFRREGERRVFVITSANPIGEWEGFMTCEMKV
jgi:Fe-S cluster assembly iron-binding protein IscA